MKKKTKKIKTKIKVQFRKNKKIFNKKIIDGR